MLPRPPVQGHLHHNITTRSRETDVLNIDISQTQNADLKETLVSYIHDEPDAYITPDILEFSLWKKVCRRCITCSRCCTHCLEEEKVVEVFLAE